MPSSEATRRASSTADSEQHPPWRADSSSSPRGHCCSVIPATKWPWAERSAAATEESTPPERATAMRIPLNLPDGGWFPEVLPVELDRPRPGVAGRLVHRVARVELGPGEESVPEAGVDLELVLDAASRQRGVQPADVFHAHALVLVAPEAEERARDAVRLVRGQLSGKAVVADGGQVVVGRGQPQDQGATHAEAHRPDATPRALRAQPAQGGLQVRQPAAAVAPAHPLHRRLPGPFHERPLPVEEVGQQSPEAGGRQARGQVLVEGASPVDVVRDQHGGAGVDLRSAVQRRHLAGANLPPRNRRRLPALRHLWMAAARDGGHDRDLVAGLQPGVQPLAQPHVLVVQEDVHELPYLALVVEQPLLEARMLPLQLLDRAAQVVRLHGDRQLAVAEPPERPWNPELGHYESP